MYRPVVAAGLSLCLAACATPPNAPEVAAESAEPAAAPIDPPPAAEDAKADAPVIEVVDVPKVPTTTVIPQRPGGGRVCRLEKRTGSNRPVRVCRSVAEIERESIESKETFEELRRSQREYEY